MDTHIRVPVETLQQAAAILLRHLETMQGPVVALDADFYWAISPEQRVDVSEALVRGAAVRMVAGSCSWQPSG